jgi:hypothetical protein
VVNKFDHTIQTPSNSHITLIRDNINNESIYIVFIKLLLLDGVSFQDSTYLPTYLLIPAAPTWSIGHP